MGRIPCPAADGTLPPAEADALGTGTPDRQLMCCHCALPGLQQQTCQTLNKILY